MNRYMGITKRGVFDYEKIKWRWRKTDNRQP